MQPLSLPLLRGRVVDLEDAQTIHAGPVRVGVEARPEHDELANAFFRRGRQRILGKASPHGDEEAQPPPGGVVANVLNKSVGVGPEDAYGQRVGKDASVIEDLMGGAESGRSESRATGLP